MSVMQHGVASIPTAAISPVAACVGIGVPCATGFARVVHGTPFAAVQLQPDIPAIVLTQSSATSLVSEHVVNCVREPRGHKRNAPPSQQRHYAMTPVPTHV